MVTPGEGGGYNPEGLIREGIRVGVFKTNFDRPFVSSSGVSMPLWHDASRYMSDLNAKSTLLHGFNQKIDSTHDMFVGVTTTGASMVGALSEYLGHAPYITVRPEATEYGLERQIEGIDNPRRFLVGRNLLLLDDTLHTGASLESVLRALVGVGAEVGTIITVSDYQIPGAKERVQAVSPRSKLLCLYTHNEFIQVALEGGTLTGEQIARFAAWRENHDMVAAAKQESFAFVR